MRQVSWSGQFEDFLIRHRTDTRPLVLILGSAALLGWLVSRSAIAASIVLAVVLGATLLITRPRFCVYILIVFSPFTSGMARGMPVPYLRLNEVILAFLVGAFLASRIAGRGNRFRITFVDLAFAIYFVGRSVLPFLAFLLRGSPIGPDEARMFLAPVQFYLIFRIVTQSLETPHHVVTAVVLLFLTSLAVCCVGLLQALQVPGINALLHNLYPSGRNIFTFLHSKRVTAVFAGDWNGAGFYFASTALLCIGLVSSLGKGFGRRVAILGANVNALLMILSGSFSSSISFLIAGGVLGIRSRSFIRLFLRILLAGAMICAVALTFFRPLIVERLNLQFGGNASHLPATFVFRMEFWRNTILPAVSQHWLLGAGPTKYGWTTEESYYVFLLFRTGVVGLFLYLSSVAYLMVALTGSLARQAGLSAALTRLCLVLLLQMVVANVAGSYFEYSGPSETLWITLGLTIASTQLTKPRDEL
jgi:hypothetical protein